MWKQFDSATHTFVQAPMLDIDFPQPTYAPTTQPTLVEEHGGRRPVKNLGAEAASGK
jgi:hypothetical protein